MSSVSDIDIAHSPDRKNKARRPETTKETVVTRGLAGHFKNLRVEPGQKIAWLKVTISIALICSLGLSWRLWISSRLFPLSPVSGFLPSIFFPLDYIWFVSLLGLLLMISIVTQPRRLILIFLALSGLLSLWDQTRWQPWFYQYLFMLAAIGLYAWKRAEAENHRTALNACRLIVISMYLWSGLQKLNVNFVREIWPVMAGPMLRLLPEALKKLPPVLALAIPLIEILMALGLITRRYRKVSVIFAIAMHVFILLLLFSSGENTVVWPWNVAMAVFVLILFWEDKETGARNILVPKSGFHAVVLLFFGVLPALSFIDLWDSYLSSALYSGNTDQAVVYVSPAVIDRLPVAIRSHIWQSSQPFFLDINRWAYGELNVPVYPEPRIYRNVTRQICAYAEGSPDIRLRILKKPDPLTGERESEHYDCDHLDF